MNAVLNSLYRDLIIPVHALLREEFGVPDTLEAACMSVAIKVQESGLTMIRDQGDPNIIGPATGPWQFEKNGGVAEILEDGKIGPIAHELCRRVGVRPERDPVWRLFTTAAGDDLSCAFARLLIFRDPAPLPARTPANAKAAYDYYHRRWRPGADREHDWPASWQAGLATVGQGAQAAPAPLPGPPTVPAGPLVAPSALEARVAALEARLNRVGAAWR